MKILALVYDFPHFKSSEGLLTLSAHGFRDVLCIAAPKKDLNIPKSSRITPKIAPLHPKDVADALGFQYEVCAHEFPRAAVMASSCTLGVIFGARVLKAPLINVLPIINMHPGLIPWNRGLDNAKWAVYRNIPQGVTVHFIDERIDMGHLLSFSTMDVFSDDTMLDLFLRGQNLELNALIKVLKGPKQGMAAYHFGTGEYFKTYPEELDQRLETDFKVYKSVYPKILKEWNERLNYIPVLWQNGPHQKDF